MDQLYELPQRPPPCCNDGCEAAVTEIGCISSKTAPRIITETDKLKMRSIMKTSLLNIVRASFLSSARMLPAFWLAAVLAPAIFAAAPADSVKPESREQLREMLPEGFMDSTFSIVAASSSEQRKSPPGALLRSLALPGWGQFYTGHPLRGTVTAVAQTAFLTGMVLKFRHRADLRNKLSQLEMNNGPEWPVDDPERIRLNFRIKRAQQKGGDYLAYGATALLLSMLDSYVSAHLYNFDRHFTLTGSGRAQLALRFGF